MVSTFSRWAGAPQLKAPAHRVRPVGLDSHHPDGWVLELHGRGDAGDEAAPSDGNHHHADARDLSGELEPHRPLAGHDRQVGAGRHHDRGLGPHGSSGVGESSRVVPGRQGHQPARPAGRVHRQELAERPAPVSIRSDERRRNANREPEWLSLPPQHSPAGSSNLRPIAGRWRTAMNDCRQLLV